MHDTDKLGKLAIDGSMPVEENAIILKDYRGPGTQVKFEPKFDPSDSSIKYTATISGLEKGGKELVLEAPNLQTAISAVKEIYEHGAVKGMKFPASQIPLEVNEKALGGIPGVHCTISQSNVSCKVPSKPSL